MGILFFILQVRRAFICLRNILKRGRRMVETTMHCFCCVLFVIAGIFDERERKIPRLISYMELLTASLCWLSRFYVNQCFSWKNFWASVGLFAVLYWFYMKGQLGRADLYLVIAMFVLLSRGQSVRALIWEENMLLCIAFLSGALRLWGRRWIRARDVQPGCPFGMHLLLGYLVTSLW